MISFNKAINKVFDKDDIITKSFRDRGGAVTNNFYPLEWISNLTKSQQDDLALLGVFNDVPELSAPVNYISNLASRVKIKIVQKNKKGEKNEILYPELTNLLENPNPYHSAINFKRYAFNNFQLFGNNYTNIYKGIGSLKPANYLFNLPPQYVTVQFEKMQYDKINPDADFRTNEITGYKLEYANSNIPVISKEEISHFKDSQVNFDNGQYAKGQSRVRSALMATETIKAGYEAKYSFYVNRGALGMFINADPDGSRLEPAEKDRVLDELKRKYGTKKGQNLFMFLNHNMTYENIAPDFDGLKILENNRADFGAICMILNFPSSLLHDYRAALVREGKAKLRELYNVVVCPIVEDYYQKLSIDLDIIKDNIWIEPDYSNIDVLKEDLLAKEDLLTKRLNRHKILYDMRGITMEMVLEGQEIMEIYGTDYKPEDTNNKNKL